MALPSVEDWLGDVVLVDTETLEVPLHAQAMFKLAEAKGIFSMNDVKKIS